MSKDPYASLKQGLVGAWIPSISGSGLLLPDLSGRGNNGTLTNMGPEDWVASEGGRALDFDGSNDKVELGARDLLRQPLSISAWALRRSSNANHTIIDGATDPSNSFGAHLRFTTANKIRWYFNNANLSTADTTTTPSLNTWHHVIGMFDGITSRIYFNGVLEASTTGDAFGTAAGSYRIGCLSTVYGTDVGVMDGQLDDIRLYSRALTESEIRLLASDRGIGFKPNKKLSRFSTRYTYQPPKAKVFEGVRVRDHDYASLRQGLVGAWCASLPNGGSGNLLVDQSGRGNNGTLVGMGPEDWVASGSGRALSFDGVDDVVQLSAIPDSPNQITATAWARQTVAISSAVYAVFGSSDSTGAISSFQLESFQGRWGFVWGANPYVRPQVSFNIVENQWYHIALVRAGSTGNWSYRFFVDGIERLSGTTTTNPGASEPIAIGRNGNRNQQFFPGNIDDIRLYSRALTESEIRLLASKRGIGLQPSPTKFIAKEKKTGLRRLLLTGQT